jgi:hypothetical protein
MTKTKQSKEIKNYYFLDIFDIRDDLIRTIEIDIQEMIILQELVTFMVQNNTGGITIRAKLKTNYSL